MAARMMEAKTALSVSGLRVSYGSNPVVRDVSFEVRENAFFVIIGPNGSGKTTILRVLSGALKPRGGKVTVLGRPIGEYSRRALARTVAVVPQQVETHFPFTVRETVLMGRSPHLGLVGLEGEKDLRIAEEAMRVTRVADLADRKLCELSGGECQRVIIARALCQEPRIVLLDEPTASLDPAHQLAVMDLMERLRRNGRITVVMVSHDLNLAALYADDLLLLKDGAVAASGKVEQVLVRERLVHVYGCALAVDVNPWTGLPRVTPLPERYRALPEKKWG